MHRRLSLDELQRIKRWHTEHRSEHPVEYHLLDAVLTLWLMGWVGLLPALVSGHVVLMSVCLLGMSLPGLYVRWRGRAHARQSVRCDWLQA